MTHDETPAPPLRQVADYYSAKVREHGETARGVDWNSEGSQSLRFVQLLRIADAAGSFSLNEIGCGYGALIDHLDGLGKAFTYQGVDLSAEMVARAQARHGSRSNATFLVGDRPDAARDFAVASGIFNVRLKTPDADWLALVHEVLDMMHETSAQGFAFNALTSYSDAEKMRDYLYYADPCALFDRCKRRYARNVAVLHDYGLYEFTILVRKDV